MCNGQCGEMRAGGGFVSATRLALCVSAGTEADECREGMLNSRRHGRPAQRLVVQ